jgi:hypothetical protein
MQVHTLLFPDAVRQVSETAHAKLPEELHGRLERATALVSEHGVFFDEDGHTCHVRASDGQHWYPVNGHCVCGDASRAPEGLCKHRIAKGLYQRAAALMQEPQPRPDAIVDDIPAHRSIPQEYLTMVYGKPFIKYAGLLTMARAAGLVKLEARFISVTAELALAEATATFADGRVFTEAANATPANVNRGVTPHFARCALTRAKSRALRDALGLDVCAVEETGE